MVNHGASAACQNCKRRKVKCDETRPACLRCLKIGKKCPGYLDEWDLAFRSENEVVKAKVLYQQSTPSRQWSSNRSTKDVSRWGTSSSLSKVGIESSSMLPDDLHEQAIRLFFQDYIIESCGLCPGYLNYLPRLYSQSTDSSLLTVAVLAASYANMAQKMNRHDITIKAMSHYRKALRDVSTILAENKEPASDTTMTSIMLLGLYECINTTISETEAMQHTQGLVVLLDIRLAVLAEGPSLLQIVCCQTQRRNLDLRILPRHSHTRLVSFPDMTQPANQMCLNMQHVSIWVAEVNSVILAGHEQASYRDLLCEFSVLEKELCDWNEAAFVSMGYQRVQSEDDSASFKHDNYPGFWTLSIWNKHRATRILLHQLLLELFQAVGKIQKLGDIDMRDFEEQELASRATIQEMTGDILSSAPFALGEMSVPPKSIGGYFLVWSLQTILRCSFVSHEQRHEARAVLEKVGRQCGIKCATMIAKSSQQYDLYKKGTA
ncbi:hypothetical protein ONS96_004688 [Cadophora gregata f. sp. sojae]|nr:hypothetical protein ONS96_004688 [Cadophora gregata f. sp. sojae]